MPEPALCQVAILGMPANALHVSNLAETSKHPNLLPERFPGLTPAPGESQQPNGLSGAPGRGLITRATMKRWWKGLLVVLAMPSVSPSRRRMVRLHGHLVGLLRVRTDDVDAGIELFPLLVLFLRGWNPIMG